MANKYLASTRGNHNGTINGIKSKKAARIERMQERKTRTATEQLEHLNAMGFAATRERKKLSKKLKGVDTSFRIYRVEGNSL